MTGDLAKPQLGAAARPESTQTDTQEQKEQKVRMEQAPDAGFDKTEGKSEDGIATNIAKTKSPSTHADTSTEGVRDAKDPDGGLVVGH